MTKINHTDNLMDIFEHLSELKGEEFEFVANQLIDNFINSVPEDRQTRLRQIQWNWDGELRKFKDPVARMNRAIEMLYEQIYLFNETLNGAEK